MEAEMLLAIDTSTRYGGVALWNEGRAVSSVGWYSTRNHTAELMPAIQHVLDRARAAAPNLGGIAVALGPGGFSALRVGISTAKGLALPLKVSIAGVGTLEMEAFPYAGMGLPICPLLDAGRDQVAAGLFQHSGGHWRKLREEYVCTLQELVESISTPTLLCGEGVHQHGEYLRRALGSNGVIVDFHTVSPRLGALAILAGRRLESGDVGPPTIQPLYIRRPSIGLPKVAQKVRQ